MNAAFIMNIHQLAKIQFLLNSEFYKASWFIRWFFSTSYPPFESRVIQFALQQD